MHSLGNKENKTSEMSRALKRPFEPDVKKLKTEPDQNPDEVGTADIIQAIKEDTAKYSKQRATAIAAVVRDFFRRNSDEHFTMYCFKNVLNGYEKDPKVRDATVSSRNIRLEFNENKDLLNRWESLRPTDAEKKIVWSALVECGFLKKTANEEYNFQAQCLGGKTSRRYKFIHVTDFPDAILNWNW